MIGKIRLASPGLLAGMTVVWLVALVGIDYVYNPHLWKKSSGEAPQPKDTALSIYINHLCCTGCFADAEEALKSIPWLKNCSMRQRGELPTIEAAEAKARQSEYGGWIDLSVPEISRIDFVEIDKALRGEGLVASRMVVRGVKHVRLVADVKHMCCGMCKDAIQVLGKNNQSSGPGLSFGAGGLAELNWIDSIVADHIQKKVTVYPRYQDPEKGFDVGELLAAMDRVGLAPFSVRIQLESSEMPAAELHEETPLRLARLLD